MPEIAEVKRYASQLQTEYGGHDLLKAEVIGGRFLKEDLALDLWEYPLTKAEMDSKGKFLWWRLLDGGELVGTRYLFFTLGMSGSFGKQQKHSALKFTFDNGEVFFNDPRHFGTCKMINTTVELSDKLNTLGWDPFWQPEVPISLLPKIRKHNRKKIGEFLLEQDTIAGVGNYLRCEILWRCKIDPFKLISELSDQQLTDICQTYVLIANEAYDHGGATIATYSDLYGNVGTFYDQFKVYGRKTDPDGFPVSKVKDKNGRTIHWVPQVQL